MTLRTKLADAKEAAEGARDLLQHFTRSIGRYESLKAELEGEISRIETYLSARSLPLDTDTALRSLRDRREKIEQSLATLNARVPELERSLADSNATIASIEGLVDRALVSESVSESAKQTT